MKLIYSLNLKVLPKSQTFSPDWPKIRTYKSRIKNKHGKNVILKSWGLVLHSFYVQLLATNFVSSINGEVWPKVKLSVWLAFSLIRAEYSPNGRKRDSQEPRV